MDTQHIIEIIIVCGVSLVGFIGVRLHSHIDKLFSKIDNCEQAMHEHNMETLKRMNTHGERLAKVEANIKHYHADAKI